MQKTLRLKQMGRQNMIPRKFRLFETDDSPKIYNGRDIITPPNPNPIYGYHLSDIESYWSNIPPKLSLQFTNFMGSRSNDPEPDSRLIKPRDQTSRFNLFV